MSSHEPIHSGQFMTSDLHTGIPVFGEHEDVEVKVVDDDRNPEEDALQDQEDDRPVTFYKFGPKKTVSVALDLSLKKVNKCIKIAYSKMTTPKWKDFEGLRLHWKQRIRLNNVIWRAYYLEFRKPNKSTGKKTSYRYFAAPGDNKAHQKMKVEEVYWKSRLEAVCAQYKRWRRVGMERQRLRMPFYRVL